MRPSDLSAARRTRVERQQLYTQLETKGLTIHELLRAPVPACLASAHLWDVLLRCPYIGETKARAICESAGVWPMTEFRRLTVAQRLALLEVLPDSQR